MKQARASVRRTCFALVLATTTMPLGLGCGSGSGLPMVQTLDGGMTGTLQPDAGVSPGSPLTPASGDDGPSGTAPGSDASDAFSPSTPDSTPEAGASCQGGGSVPPSQIAMIGDSYLDPAWCLAGNDIMANARAAGSLAMGASYRQYQLGGASMAWGNPYTNFYIPYQYENTLMNDLAYMNPKVIDTIIMDGGGNDVLIGNSSCETTAPPGNTSCLSTVNSAIMRAQSLLQEMATNGVKHIVYIFYPHLDPAGGGILSTPAPAVNDSLDFAYPLAEQICCGSSFTSTATSYSCTGHTGAAECNFIDTRPAFEGHLADYIKSDHVHPTPAGAQVIADLVWKVMQDHCIAQ